jgi:hypothetical protein
MNPDLQRFLMAALGVICLVLAYFLPEQRELLLATGVGLLGWAKKAPGHDGGGSTAATLVLLVIISENLVSCAARPESPPCDEATLAGIVAECSARVRECPKEGPCQAEDDCSRRLDEREALCLKR